MSFSDNLENNLKNLESHDERDAAGGAKSQQRRQAHRANVLASAPNAEKLRNSKFTAGLLTHVTRIGHGLRTKVNIIWLGSTLRLQAREHRLEVRPTPDGVVAHFLTGDAQAQKEKADLRRNPENPA